MSTLISVCPSCDARNRIHPDRGTEARCGRCHSALFPREPFVLTEANASAQCTGDVPLLIDVWADWCGPCRAFAPIFEQAALRHAGRCRFAKLDSEAQPNLAGRWGIRSIPTLLLFRDGREIARQSGALPAPQLEAWWSSHGID